MLAYVLALVIGLASIAMYMAAFFLPEVHRKEDFIWSGVGLFYALVLWVCAGRITGGVLLGQVASVALLGWFGWQTLTLRRSLVPPEQQTPVPSQNELQGKLKDLSSSGNLQGLQQRVTGLFGKGKSEPQSPQTPSAAPVSSPSVAIIDSTTTQKQPTEVQDTASANAAPTVETSSPEATQVTPPTTAPETQEESPVGDAETLDSPELVRPNPPAPELIEAAKNSAPSDAVESSQDAATPIEEIAPEVELAPPAEPPGSGDPEERKTES
jgi:hypothetical protein